VVRLYVDLMTSSWSFISICLLVCTTNSA
jgi:hypothetical protein